MSYLFNKRDLFRFRDHLSLLTSTFPLTVLETQYFEYILRSMEVIMKLILVIAFATLASAGISDSDPPVSSTRGRNLDAEFPRKFQGILQQSMNKAVDHIRELRPNNFTVFYKQPNGKMDVTVVAAFGAISVKGVNFLELDDDLEVYRSKNRNVYLELFLKGQPLKFDAHVTVSSMGMAATFQAFGKISFKFFYGNIYHQYSPKPSIMVEECNLEKPVMDLDAFVPNWLNRTTLITESVKQLLPLVDKHISKEFSKHVLLNLNLDAVEDTLNKYRKSN